jgi:hypothetical protein
MSQAWTVADRDTLAALIASGAKVVEFKDRRIERHGLDEMRSLLAEMNASLGASGGSPPRTHRFGRVHKGL